MHYIDFDSKTRQTIVRFITYAVIGIIAFVVSVIILYAARGYDVDPSTGQVIRNGLVLVWSQPEAADLYVDGVLEENTPARLPLPTGSYDLELVNEGYRNWSKTVSVYGSEVVKVNYPRMFPNDIQAESAAKISGVDYWSQSPSQEFMLVHSQDDQQAMRIFDLENLEQVPQIITIPRGRLTLSNDQVGTILPTQWSADSKFILAEHKAPGVNEFIRINIETEEVINLNRQIPQALKDVQFDRSENDFVYGVTNNGQLRRADLRDGELSDALAANIVEYRVANDGRVVAIQHRENKAFVIQIDEDGVVEPIISGPRTSSNQVELGNYEGDHYAVVSIKSNEAKIVWLDEQKEYNDNVLATFTGNNIKVHPVSFTARFSLVSSGSELIVHDFEKFRVHPFGIQNVVPKTISWFDDGHVIGVAGGKIIIKEFDGANRTVLGDAANFKIYAGKGFENFYSLKNTAGQFDFNVSNLRLLEN